MSQNRILVVLLGWSVAVATTFAIMARDENLRALPAKAQLHTRVSGRPTLVMAIHPQCPCSRATISGLAGILALSAQPVAVEILAFQPASAGPTWLDTPSIRALARLPRATVIADRDGYEASRQGLTVSGEIQFFSADGDLRFAGGITGSRGHAGPNRAASLLASAIAAVHPSATLRAPVFGCSLVTPRAATEAVRD